jgi:hypothetical protein
METNDKKILKDFQSEHNRRIEESFAQILTEQSDVRLFFINENMCHTDGKNIVIDPGFRELFADKDALIQVEEILRLDHDISEDPVLALKMNTRSINVHESLHIIYTNFPPDCVNDERASDLVRRSVLSAISNIIEDAFIEAAGCSEFDNLEHLLMWNRMALGLARYEGPTTIDQKFEQAIKSIKSEQKNEAAMEKTAETSDNDEQEETARALLAPIMGYIDYMAGFLLYPFFKQESPPLPLAGYVEKTKQLFIDGSVCGNADERYGYTQKIFDIVETLLPKTEVSPDLIEKLAEKLLGGTQTHNGKAPSLANNASKGKTAKISRKLFCDTNGNPLSGDDIKDKFRKQTEQFENEIEENDETDTLKGSVVIRESKDYDSAAIHHDIKIEVRRPKINLNLKRAYQNLVNKYRLSINSYTMRFSQLLKGTVDEIEEKKYFGKGISSKHFTDPKKRFWYRKVRGEAVPDTGFLILIDGSGSMEGDRMEGAMASAIILHEVLRSNNVEHAIVEHRAIYGEPLLVHNVLVGFGARNEEKYNLLGLDSGEGTREGLTLYWAEEYLKKQCRAENKIIIMISDGAPAHSYEDGFGAEKEYYPSLSVKDTALAVKKITRRGTGIIAIALDDEDDYECYEQLKAIYGNVVSCTDIGKLTGQLLGLVTKSLKKV